MPHLAGQPTNFTKTGIYDGGALGFFLLPSVASQAAVAHVLRVAQDAELYRSYAEAPVLRPGAGSLRDAEWSEWSEWSEGAMGEQGGLVTWRFFFVFYIYIYILMRASGSLCVWLMLVVFGSFLVGLVVGCSKIGATRSYSVLAGASEHSPVLDAGCARSLRRGHGGIAVSRDPDPRKSDLKPPRAQKSADVEAGGFASVSQKRHENESLFVEAGGFPRRRRAL